ncbi:ArsA-related P-loop ATPase [Paraburkholderia sp. A3BS-1L]|uniref:ArsA-related P-loop ATPase n=1 Tax=Paraburkholderia sp. A3BS-1L TaxID=3028375 RepID=UPI003DA852D8
MQDDLRSIRMGKRMPPRLALLDAPTRYLFFTGKGGVGKTSVSTAASIALADAGKKVLLVSTDAASNLDEMLGVELTNSPVSVPGVVGLLVLNIDPDVAAENYRARVVEQMSPDASAEEITTVREQLSGACTTEIATFDSFPAYFLMVVPALIMWYSTQPPLVTRCGC